MTRRPPQVDPGAGYTSSILLVFRGRECCWIGMIRITLEQARSVAGLPNLIEEVNCKVLNRSRAYKRRSDDLVDTIAAYICQYCTEVGIASELKTVLRLPESSDENSVQATDVGLADRPMTNEPKQLVSGHLRGFT